jgi:hypothetical protein
MLIENTLSEQLHKYQVDVESDAKGAASELITLIDKLVPLVAKSLKRAGPFVAPTLRDDFVKEVSQRIKEIPLPTVSSLTNIMQDVERASEEIKAKEAEAETPKAPVKAAPASAAPTKPETKTA